LLVDLLAYENKFEELGEDEWRSAALMAAAYLGRTKYMDILISAGTPLDLDPKDKLVFPPIMMAAFVGQIDAINLLQQRGADLNQHTAKDWRMLFNLQILGLVIPRQFNI
jgi:ankyrin repeat protein